MAMEYMAGITPVTRYDDPFMTSQYASDRDVVAVRCEYEVFLFNDNAKRREVRCRKHRSLPFGGERADEYSTTAFP